MTTSHAPLRKAAILLTVLDRASADALIAQLPASAAAAIRKLQAGLGPVSAEEQRQVLEEFVTLGGPAADEDAGVELDGQLAQLMSRRAALPPAAPTASAARDAAPFRFLHEASGERLAPLLADERPTTIALVLSHLPPEQSGTVLGSLPAAVQSQVLRALAELDETDPAILRAVEQGLEARVADVLKVERRRAAGVSAVKGILDAAPPKLRETLVAALAAHDTTLAAQLVEGTAPAEPESARRAARRRVTFGELAAQGPATWETLLDAVPWEVLVLAMVGATPEQYTAITRQLPPTVVKRLHAAPRSLGPTRLSDLEEAQRQLCRIAGRLLTAGRLPWQETTDAVPPARRGTTRPPQAA
jgi:flagellar motor switch protein FliG